MNQREIAGLLNVSPAGIGNAIKDLVNNDLVRVDKNNKINLSLVELNRRNSIVMGLKRVENLKMIYESGFAGFFEKNFPGCLVILFGSYSFGEDTVESDVDIAVFGSEPKNLDLRNFEKNFEREINVNYYKDLKNVNKNLKSNILNGITLQGFVEL